MKTTMPTSHKNIFSDLLFTSCCRSLRFCEQIFTIKSSSLMRRTFLFSHLRRPENSRKGLFTFCFSNNYVQVLNLRHSNVPLLYLLLFLHVVNGIAVLNAFKGLCWKLCLPVMAILLGTGLGVPDDNLPLVFACKLCPPMSPFLLPE